MKIPITFLNGSNQHLSKYTQLLFKYLQKDERFEKLTLKARKRFNITAPTVTNSNELDVEEKVIKPLRSEFHLIPAKNEELEIWIKTPQSKMLDQEITRIVQRFPFFQDWRRGLANFILGGRFIVSDESSKIKLAVRNNKYPYLGRNTDFFRDEGVKIVLTSKINKNELTDWINLNWPLIVYYLRLLPNFSHRTSRKDLFERDRLITYLRLFTIWPKKMFWKDIGDLFDSIFDETPAEDALQQAVKDFPYK